MKWNLNTGSLARWAASHPKLTLGAWALMLLAAFALMSTLLGSALTTDSKVMNNPESKQADTLLSDRLGASDSSEEIVIVRSSTFTVDDPEFQSNVEKLFGDLTGLGNDVVLGGVNYYMTGENSLVSADRHATIMLLKMPPDADKVVDKVHKVVDDANQGGAFEVLVTGDASFSVDAIKLAEDTLKTGEVIGISVALVVLALVFGAIAAALLPVAVGIVAVVGALGLTALVGQAMDLTFMVTNIITMMGLAVGIDYSLFILSRYREEREHGLDKIEAIAAAGATASRAVLFSGMMVALALVGLVIFPDTVFQTMGIGAILVVSVAVLASLTLLPAILGILGDKVNAIRIPFIQRRAPQKTSHATGGFWVWMTRVVTRRPVISLVVGVAVLVMAAIPYFDANMGMSGISALPDDLRAKKGFVALQEQFGFGMDAPAVIVIDGQTDSAAVQAGIARLRAAIASDGTFVSSVVEVHEQANLSVVSARLVGDPVAKNAMDAVVRLRSHYIPEAFAGVPAKVLVTGETAGVLDFNRTTGTYTPIVFGFVLALSFVLLTVAFRSIVVPAMSIVMNLLSVGAAYGLLVLVFQKGVGASLFGFQQVDVIESWLPLFLFAILFGLSMDYQVFLLSRIRERFNRTGNSTEAVSFGLSSTGRLITGAALIMVAVFGGFALGDMVNFQQMGFGLAVAVLMDATIVRSVLVPATMKLLGSRSWYMPKWLEFLPNIAIGEHVREQTVANRVIGVSGRIGELVPVPDPVMVEIHVRDTDEATDLKNIT